jgi:elongation factor Ts
MANISASLVKELREKTGAGMMDCKNALVACDGDIEKAIDELRKKGLSAAAKKAGRITSEGLVSTWVSDDEKLGVLVEVNCETDFVAKNPDFIGFVNTLLTHIAKKKPCCMDDAECKDALLNQPWIENDAKTVKDIATDLVAVIRENITPRRFERWETEAGLIHTYIHMGGKLGVMVELSCSPTAAAKEAVKTFAHQVAMHAAASNPVALDRASVSEATLLREREIYKQQVLDSGKPLEIADKIIEGKVTKFYKDSCLLEQIWVHDTTLSVDKALAAVVKEVGEPVAIKRFARFQLGEGLAKRSTDLAAEVAAQLEGK